MSHQNRFGNLLLLACVHLLVVCGGISTMSQLRGYESENTDLAFSSENVLNFFCSPSLQNATKCMTWVFEAIKGRQYWARLFLALF